jgi:predicted nucleotidyltransferase
MERLLSELVEKMRKAHGERLVSVVLYGSGAEPEATKDRFSDYNVLCVLDRIGEDELRRSETIFRWWREMKNPAPVLLTTGEVRTSTDCFPIEFHDMKERHRTLFGEDVITGMEVDDSFYRAMVEHELRAKMLRLRQKAGGMLSEKDLLLRLMADSISTFCVLFRHALRLIGEAPKYGKRDVIASSAARFGFDSAPFVTLLDLREEKIKPKDVEALSLFRDYLNQIETVVDAVDRLEK